MSWRRWQRERKKKTKKQNKTTNKHAIGLAHAFLDISLPSLHDSPAWECLISRLTDWGRDVSTKFFFPFWTWFLALEFNSTRILNSPITPVIRLWYRLLTCPKWTNLQLLQQVTNRWTPLWWMIEKVYIFLPTSIIKHPHATKGWWLPLR